jgi:hypothetical protein
MENARENGEFAISFLCPNEWVAWHGLAALRALTESDYYHVPRSACDFTILHERELSQMQTGQLRPIVNGIRNSAVSYPEIGELIYIRVDVQRATPGNIPATLVTSLQSGSSSAIGSATRGDKAEGENEDFQPHPCIVLGCNTSNRFGIKRWSVDVVVCRSYSDLSPQDIIDNMHIPLPPPPGHPALPTPPLFGDPLQVSIVPKKCMWAVSVLKNIDMGGHGSVSRESPNSTSVCSMLTRFSTCSIVVLTRPLSFRKRNSIVWDAI